MRITGISPASFNQNRNNNKNVSFGKFEDIETKKAIQKIAIWPTYSCAPEEFEDYEEAADEYMKRLENAKYANVYIDKNDGKVKAKFDDEYLKTVELISDFPEDKGVTLDQMHYAFDNLDVLDYRPNIDLNSDNYERINSLNVLFEIMDKTIAGKTFEEIIGYDKNRPGPQNYAAMRAEEEAYHG